ncbi:hypothetical protein M5689_013705 [Euphorbia peplus]|nr:hypothetical protein M5689_013705 [Euphorbia peplus]
MPETIRRNRLRVRVILEKTGGLKARTVSLVNGIPTLVFYLCLPLLKNMSRMRKLVSLVCQVQHQCKAHVDSKNQVAENKLSGSSNVALQDSGPPSWGTASSLVIGGKEVPEAAIEWLGYSSNLVSASSLNLLKGLPIMLPCQLQELTN